MPTSEPVDPDWWRAFNDPVLTGLVRRAAEGNLDIQAATARLAQSRAQRGITAADLYPTINGNASYTREKPSSRGAFSAISGGSGGGTGGASSSAATQSNGLGGRQGGFQTPGAIPAFDLFQGGFDATWELDLWGRVRRGIESADASLQASREARRAALLSTVAEVARDYMQLRGTQDTLRITRANLASAQESARLTGERARGGLATDLDVANARAQVESTAAAIPQLEQQETQTINAIGLLLGQPPATLQAELSGTARRAARAAPRARRTAVRAGPAPPRHSPGRGAAPRRHRHHRRGAGRLLPASDPVRQLRPAGDAVEGPGPARPHLRRRPQPDGADLRGPAHPDAAWNSVPRSSRRRRSTTRRPCCRPSPTWTTPLSPTARSSGARAAWPSRPRRPAAPLAWRSPATAKACPTSWRC